MTLPLINLHTCGCRTETGFFCNTFFNQTVDVVDQPRYIDTQLVFLGFIGLGVLAVIGKFSCSNHSVAKAVPKSIQVQQTVFHALLLVGLTMHFALIAFQHVCRVACDLWHKVLVVASFTLFGHDSQERSDIY